MLTLIAKSPHPDLSQAQDTIALTAEERQRSFYRCTSEQGQPMKINLKRGTVLRDGDLLLTEADANAEPIKVAIAAKPEPVITVTAEHPLHLLKAAYHLGNRHVALEVTETYLRLTPDPVLRDMLTKMPVTITDAIAPFHPETGAYHHHHG